MTDHPRCGAVCTASGRGAGARCRRRVAREGLRCPLHQRDELPVLEDAPER